MIAPGDAAGSAASPAAEPAGRCGGCHWFCAVPAELERQLPGFRTLGSAFGSVRADDGLCVRHDRYLGPRCRCADFRARGVAAGEPDAAVD